MQSVDEFLLENAGLSIPHPLECLNISVCTSCSLVCRFCAYQHSKIPRQVMDNDLFFSLIDRATRFGYRVFNITPLVGEVLLDPGFLEKLAYLEDHPMVKYFFFSSNLTEADETFFSSLKELSKLNWFSVSLYGLNPTDYQKVTGAPERVFNKVIENLERMRAAGSFGGRSEIKVREPGPQAASAPLPECVEILDGLESQGVQIRYGVRIMNWGGLVKRSDMEELDLDYKAVEKERALPCAFLFHKPSILPDGVVTACSCGDAHASLSIGNLTQQRFSEIFSTSNEAYREMLAGQISGRLPAACCNCSGYRPLDRHWYSYEYYDREFIPLQGFFDWLATNSQNEVNG